jgi:hypothetical protein
MSENKSKIVNVPLVTDREVINAKREAHGHRAKWAAIFYEEAKTQGIDLEPIYRKAIYNAGAEQAKKLPLYQENNGNITVKQFSDFWLARNECFTFEKKRLADEEDTFTIELNYCPLVKMWQDMGLPDEEIAMLCDCAMEGDRGEADTFGMNLDLQTTIARGDRSCRMVFTKNKADERT